MREPGLGRPQHTETEIQVGGCEETGFEFPGVQPVLHGGLVQAVGRGCLVVVVAAELGLEVQVGGIGQVLDRCLVAPLGLQIDAVLVGLQDGFIGRIKEAVVQLDAVFADELVLGVVGVGVDAARKGDVVVAAGGPLAQESLAEVEVRDDGILPVLGLLHFFGDVLGGAEGFGRFRGGGLGILCLGHQRGEQGDEGKDAFHIINRILRIILSDAKAFRCRRICLLPGIRRCPRGCSGW